MQVEFAHANYQFGKESYLIRFANLSHASSYTPCLLVDSGKNVDVDELLDESDYLVGILLTHAHSDHYKTLCENICDGANVFTSPATATVLDTVLQNAQKHTEIGDITAVQDALTPITDWTTLIDGVQIHPVPAGHTPGAAGFLIQFRDQNEWHTMLATGDFTTSRSGGYPELAAEYTMPVDTVFLTGATSTADDRETLLTGVSEAATNGAPVLVSATGLSCVEYAYLFGHASATYDLNIEITIAGHAAKLYDALNYDVPHVTSRPTFNHPSDLVTPGEITLAGPQVPRNGTSSQVFDHIQQHSNGLVVQVTDGAADPVSSASCRITHLTHIAHPTEDEIDDFVQTLNPTEMVITHQRCQGIDRFKNRYQSYVWSTDDNYWHTLYDNGWQAPPWMTEEGKRRVRKRDNDQSQLTATIDGNLPGPSLTRTTDVSFEQEGLEMNYCDDKLTTLAYATPSTTDTGTSTPTDDTSRPTTPTGTDSPNKSDPVTGTKPASTDGGTGTASTSETTGCEHSTDTDSNSPTATETHATPTVASVKVVTADDGMVLLRLTDANGSVRTLEHGDEFDVLIPNRTLHAPSN